MKEDLTVLRGEVYLCNLGNNGGSVQRGLRPVVVVQNNYGNQYSDTVIVVPVTKSKSKAILPTHFSIELKETSTVLCEQITTVPKSTLRDKVYYLSGEEITKLDLALKTSLEVL